MYNFSIMQIASELLTELPLQMSAPGSPGRSRPSSRPASRPQSPTRGSRPSPLQPIGLRATSKDPLKAFPTDVSQQIFSLLSIKDLARCSRVSKKWNKSQTLNYGASPSDRHRSAGSLTTHDVQFGSSSTGKRISMMKAFHQGSGPSASPSRIGYVFCIQPNCPTSLTSFDISAPPISIPSRTALPLSLLAPATSRLALERRLLERFARTSGDRRPSPRLGRRRSRCARCTRSLAVGRPEARASLGVPPV